jgi:hypothetical protein
VTLNADVVSGSGNVGVLSAGNVRQNADIQAGGDVVVSSGGSIIMTGDAVTRAEGGELIYRADSNINLGLVQATNVNLDAGGDITDVRNDNTVNVRATNLRMTARSEIGDASPADAANANSRAIDTLVTNVAAKAADGIYIQELTGGDGLTIRDVADISVTINAVRANFNSTRSDVLAESGPLLPRVLQT